MRTFLFLTIIVTQSLFADPFFEEMTPSSCGCCTDSFNLGIDWLYWKGEQSQMEIASNVVFNGGTTISAGSITPQFDYASGFRLYGNYEPNSCWSLGISFVYLPTNTSQITSAAPDGFINLNQSLYPIFTVLNEAGINFRDLDLKWKSDLYYLDVPFKYTFHLPYSISVEPYIGLRGFWMNQKLNIQANSLSPTTAGVMTSLMSEKIYGAGFLGGVQAAWEFCNGFMVIAKFGSSLVYTRVDIDLSLGLNPALGGLQIGSKGLYNRSISSFESFIGLAYRFDLRGVCGQLRLGWENNLFFNTNQFSITTGGNLNLQGLTFGGSIYF